MSDPLCFSSTPTATAVDESNSRLPALNREIRVCTLSCSFHNFHLRCITRDRDASFHSRAFVWL